MSIQIAQPEVIEQQPISTEDAISRIYALRHQLHTIHSALYALHDEMGGEHNGAPGTVVNAMFSCSVTSAFLHTALEFLGEK